MTLYSLLCICYYPQSDPAEWPSTSAPFIPVPKTLTLNPITYPPSPKFTNTPTISLPARQQIHTRKDFNTYIYIWLKINMKGEYASDTENELYRKLVGIYG